MGGRGASSGMSDNGKSYGTEYKSLLKKGNIKFIQKTAPDSQLFETMTRGRVYAEINNKNEVKTIYYFDKENKKSKSIDLRHFHKGMNPHTHHGYIHNEKDGPKGASNLTSEEKRMVDKVLNIWYDYIHKQ